MPTLRQVRVPLAGLALLAALAGCGGTPAATSTGPGGAPSTAPTSLAPTPDTTAPSETPGAGPTVTLVRTGGFAGVWQQVRVAPDGSWSYLARPQHFPTRGRLTATQRERLTELVAEPGLLVASGPAVRPPCPDSYQYMVVVGATKAYTVECTLAAERPALAAVIELLIDATPL